MLAQLFNICFLEPLFEVDPVVAEGQKRERKKVARFSEVLDSSHKQETHHRDELPTGRGVKLGDIPRGLHLQMYYYFKTCMSRFRVEELLQVGITD